MLLCSMLEINDVVCFVCDPFINWTILVCFFNFAWRFEDGNNTVTMKCMVNETWNGTESNCTGMSTYYIQT